MIDIMLLLDRVIDNRLKKCSSEDKARVEEIVLSKSLMESFIEFLNKIMGGGDKIELEKANELKYKGYKITYKDGQEVQTAMRELKQTEEAPVDWDGLKITNPERGGFEMAYTNGWNGCIDYLKSCYPSLPKEEKAFILSDAQTDQFVDGWLVNHLMPTTATGLTQLLIDFRDNGATIKASLPKEMTEHDIFKLAWGYAKEYHSSWKGHTQQEQYDFVNGFYCALTNVHQLVVGMTEKEITDFLYKKTGKLAKNDDIDLLADFQQHLLTNKIQK